MKRKVFAIHAYNGDCCLMLVNSTDCRSAVNVAKRRTDIEYIVDAEFLQAEEVYGLVYHTDEDEECVIKVFTREITLYD